MGAEKDGQIRWPPHPGQYSVRKRIAEYLSDRVQVEMRQGQTVICRGELSTGKKRVRTPVADNRPCHAISLA